MLLAHIRSFLARHRGVHWAAVAAVAIAAGGIVASRSAALDRAQRSWGERVTVWIAAGDVGAGGPVAARSISAPLALVPDGALTADPTGDAARRPIVAGEILTAAAVGSGESLAPAGWRGVAIPADESTLPVEVGDRVDVVAVGTTLAHDAIVVASSSASVVVAVPPDDAPGVAAAALERIAVLTLRM